MFCFSLGGFVVVFVCVFGLLFVFYSFFMLFLVLKEIMPKVNAF